MKINQHNLEIAKHCKAGIRPLMERLKVTGSSTVATCGPFCITVSALENSEPEQTYIDASTAMMMAPFFDPPAELDTRMYDPSPADAVGFDERVVLSDVSEPSFEFALRLDYLRTLVEAMETFSEATDDTVMLRFHQTAEPNTAIVQMVCRNRHNQTFAALLASVARGAFQKRFK